MKNSKRATVSSYRQRCPSSLILLSLKMEAVNSSETSAFTRATQRHIPEDDIFHTHRRENLKSCNILLLMPFITVLELFSLYLFNWGQRLTEVKG
jgi:hypothetical protein